MPHRIIELEKIAVELTDLARRATDINELQIAKAIVDVISLTRGSEERIAAELRAAQAEPPPSP